VVATATRRSDPNAITFSTLDRRKHIEPTFVSAPSKRSHRAASTGAGRVTSKTKYKHGARRNSHAFQGNTGDSLRRGAQEPLYETATFSVRQVPHFAEIRYGVHFNNTDESGLYTVFYGDRDDPYIGFYRSDAGFTKEINLDDIPIDEPV
jgi:hypothetical protein